MTRVAGLDTRQLGELKAWLEPFFGASRGNRGRGGSSTTRRSLEVVFDRGGAQLAASMKQDVRLGFACSIVGWTVLADQSGSVVVGVWKDTLANYPPTSGDSIAASDKPTLSSATSASDTALTGWTTAVARGDTLRFNLDSVSGLTRVTCVLDLVATE